MCCSSAVLLLSRNQIGKLFSSEHGVVMLTAQAVPPLAVSLIGEGANTVLAGVMRGCGRQRIGATINLVTYWLFGLPIACLLAFPGWLGVCACVCVWGGGMNRAGIRVLAGVMHGCGTWGYNQKWVLAWQLLGEGADSFRLATHIAFRQARLPGA
jgi:Na+-driven multidrug efflux pump